MPLPSNFERRQLEQLADQMEVLARRVISKDTDSWDAAQNEVNVSRKLYAYAWEIKQMARAGTASYGI